MTSGPDRRVGSRRVHFKISSDGPAADQAAAFSKRADKAGKKAEIYIYPGGHHAFAQPLFNAGKTFDPVGAIAAWAVTENFLERKLYEGSRD